VLEREATTPGEGFGRGRRGIIGVEHRGVVGVLKGEEPPFCGEIVVEVGVAFEVVLTEVEKDRR